MIRALPLTITLALFLGAVLVQVIPGAGPDDALGASILAAIIFVMGGISLMVSLLLLWWERRKGLSRSKGKLITAGIAIACYASPFVMWGWDSMARERTRASYNLQFKVPQSTNVEAWEYEISGATGSMSGPFDKTETNDAGNRLNHFAWGTSGSVASQSANNPS